MNSVIGIVGDDDDAQINEINAEAFDNNLTLALVQTIKDTLTNSNIARFSDIVDLFSSEEFSNEIKIKINQLRNQELNVDRMDVDGILVDDILANQYLSELPHYNNLIGDIFEGIINTLKHNEMDDMADQLEDDVVSLKLNFLPKTFI